VLAAQVEQVVRRLVDHPGATRDRRDLLLERAEVRGDEAAEAGESIAERRGAVHVAHVGEAVQDRRFGLDCERRHGLSFRCTRSFQRFLKYPATRKLQRHRLAKP